MHSTIFQLSISPIEREDYLRLDNVEAGEMVSVGYLYEGTPESTANDILHLVEYVLPKGMFTFNADNSLTYNGGINKWRRYYLDLILTKAKAITPQNIMEYIGPKYQLEKAIFNPLGTEMLFVTESYQGGGVAERSAELMRMVSGLQKGDKIYIGAVYGYHN